MKFSFVVSLVLFFHSLSGSAFGAKNPFYTGGAFNYKAAVNSAIDLDHASDGSEYERYFQNGAPTRQKGITTPARFKADPEMDWDKPYCKIAIDFDYALQPTMRTMDKYPYECTPIVLGDRNYVGLVKQIFRPESETETIGTWELFMQLNLNTRQGSTRLFKTSGVPNTEKLNLLVHCVSPVMEDEIKSAADLVEKALKPEDVVRIFGKDPKSGKDRITLMKKSR